MPSIQRERLSVSELAEATIPLIIHPKFPATRESSFSRIWKKTKASLNEFLRKKLYQEEVEQKKVVIEQSLSKAVLHCAVHFVPIAAITVLAILNLDGFFIGSEYQGISGDAANAIDTLCLQTTAKMMELFIVASLGTIVSDVIRHELLFSRDGLPFGLLGSTSAFKDLSFFLSSEFWYSSWAISSRRKKLWLITFLSISGLLAVFCGPASALLMIPAMRTSWPGGGTIFWLVGDNSTLWPHHLTSSDVGGDSCLSPTAETLLRDQLNQSGCIWYSTSSLAQTILSWHFNDGIRNVTITDGTYERSIAYLASSNTYQDTWTLSSNAAVGLFSSQIADYWEDAIFNAPITRSIGTFANIKYRVRSGTIARIATLQPVVRSRCNYYENIVYNDSASTPLWFPALPEYEENSTLANILNVTSRGSDTILSQWIESPYGHPNSTVSDFPTAYSLITMPRDHDNNTGHVFACSIDARWALGNNIATHVRDVSSENFIQHGELHSTVSTLPAQGFAPVDDGTWSKIAIDLDWLYTLTPILGNVTSNNSALDAPTWTSLSSLLVSAGFDNSSGDIVEWYNIRSPLEGVLALLVVEGLARIGMSENGGQLTHFNDAEELLNYPPIIQDGWNALLRNGSALNPPPEPGTGAITPLHWSVTVAGLSYSADSTAYFLALTVLFTYILIAIGHIVYSLYRRRISHAWDKFNDLIALSHSSRPNPEALKNTSVEINSKVTLQRHVKVRVATGAERIPNQEEVQLLFDTVGNKDFRTVEVEKKYGAVRKDGAVKRRRSV